MNDREINEQIAELCGWEWREITNGIDGSTCKMLVHPGGFGYDLPDYLNDLNATNQMEHTLSPAEWISYTDHLWVNSGDFREDVRASARMRCKSFLWVKLSINIP